MLRAKKKFLPLFPAKWGEKNEKGKFR